MINGETSLAAAWWGLFSPLLAEWWRVAAVVSALAVCAVVASVHLGFSRLLPPPPVEPEAGADDTVWLPPPHQVARSHGSVHASVAYAPAADQTVMLQVVER